MQLVIPQGHTVFERGPVAARAQELVRRGAIGVFNLLRLPGNELSRDFNCGNPCFNIGGRDGFFLENVFARAAQAGVVDRSARASASPPTHDRISPPRTAWR